MNKFILLTSKDPWLAPTGGTSSFASQLLHEYKDVIAVASMTSEKVSARRWIDRRYHNWDIKYLCLGRSSSHSKRLIPERVLFFGRVLINKRKIKELGIRNIFVDSPEAILALSPNWSSICYIFHGLNNPVSNSRYKSFRRLGAIFENIVLNKLKKLSPDCILAAADNRAITEYIKRTNFKAEVGTIIPFPTRVDDEIFYPTENIEALRIKLDIKAPIVFTVVGRLSAIKGWHLLIDAFEIFKKTYPDSFLVFVGGGEDREEIEAKVAILNLEDSVLITGMINPTRVAEYINIADLCLVGSFYEGWSVAMCEMLACGKTIVSTDISGAEDMVINDRNGYIVKERDPEKYAEAMKKALTLQDGNLISLRLASKYMLKDLKQALDSHWPRNEPHAEIDNHGSQADN